MSTATITTKGQVTIPKKVRDNMHLNTGDRIEFIKLNHERYEIIAVTKNIQQLKGVVKSNNLKPVTIEDMNSAIASMGR